jgi:hypothetical protein
MPRIVLALAAAAALAIAAPTIASAEEPAMDAIAPAPTTSGHVHANGVAYYY